MRDPKNSPPSNRGQGALPEREIDGRWSLAPYLALILSLLYALPTVGAAFPALRNATGVGSLETYLVFGLSVIISAGLILHTRAGLAAIPKPVVVCFSICLGIFTIKLLIYLTAGEPIREGFQMWRERTLGFIFAMAVCVCVAQMSTAGARRRLLDLLSHTLAIVFLLQVVLSLYEARTGIILERQESEITTSLESLQTRDVLSQTEWGIESLGLLHPITGLLGQFNRFGIACVFFNLLFLAQLAIKWRWSYLFLAGVALAAVVLNTTKTAVITIVLTDVLILCLNRRMPGWFRGLVFLGAITGGIIFGVRAVDLFLFQTSGQLTLSIRGSMWAELWRLYAVYGLDSLAHVIFGLDYTFFLTHGVSRSGSMLSFGSYENEAFLLIFNFGLLGFAGFVYAFYVDAWRQLTKVPKELRLIFGLLPINIFLCSITMDCQTKWYSLPLIMVVFLLCVSGQERLPGVTGLRGRKIPRGMQ